MSAAYPFALPHNHPASAASCPASLKRTPILWIWARRIVVRRHLGALHREQLRDAGLDPYVVRAEAMKAFWRA